MEFPRNQKGTYRFTNRIWRGVTLQLFLVAVLPLTVLVLLVTFGSLRLHHQAMRSLVADRNLRAVNSAAASISKAINHRGTTLELVLSFYTLNQQSAGFLNQVQEKLAIFDGGLAAVNSDGIPIFYLGEPAIQDLANSTTWPLLLPEIEKSIPGKAEYLPVQIVGEELYIPVLVTDPQRNALVGLFKPDTLLADGLAIVSHDEPVTILVVDPQFRILYRSGRPGLDEDPRRHPGIQSALGGSGGIEYFQAGDGEHVITTSTIFPIGWALMIEETWEDIASPLLRVTQNAPLIAVPILVLSLLALWFGLRQIVQPMQTLEERASDLARGDFDTIRQPVGGVPEIQRLQKTLIDMAVQLKEAQNSLHSYIGAITDSAENERRNLARELHDETLQSMIALGQYTQYALLWNKDAKVEKTLEQVTALSEQGTKNLRRLIQGLRPIYIEDLGLSTALAMLATNHDYPDGVEVHFLQEGNERRLKPEAEMALYRIAQEALSNVQRHSEAKNAWITLRFSQEEINLEIRDDGQGFELPPDPSHYARKGHYGLLGLYERSELVGAKLVIRSSPGKGSLIIVHLSASDKAEIDG